MRLIVTLCIIIGAFTTLHAQTTKTGTDSTTQKTSLKAQMAGHSWKYVGMERFHAKTKADSTQRKDVLILNADMTFTQVEGTKNYAGVWNVNETSKMLSLTDNATKSTRNIQVLKIVDGQLVF
jgi:hypothetical protein